MQLIDLSLPIENGMPVYPGDVNTRIDKLVEPKIMEAGWTAHNITMSLHAGTHIEAPSHSVQGGRMLDDYPLERFRGSATTIKWEDIGSYEVTTEILLLYSGFDKWWGNEKYFSPIPLSQLEAEWIAGLGIKVLGLDIISVGDINIHRLIQTNDILLVESMCNLERLLYKQANLYMFPLKTKNTEASPVRAVAELV